MRLKFMPFAVAVGTVLADRPPHRSVRAELPHTALTVDVWRRNAGPGKDGPLGEAGSRCGPTDGTSATAAVSADCDGGALPTNCASPGRESSISAACCQAPQSSCNTPVPRSAATVLAHREVGACVSAVPTEARGAWSATASRLSIVAHRIVHGCDPCLPCA